MKTLQKISKKKDFSFKKPNNPITPKQKEFLIKLVIQRYSKPSIQQFLIEKLDRMTVESAHDTIQKMLLSTKTKKNPCS